MEDDTAPNDAADVHLHSDLNNIHEVLVVQQVKILFLVSNIRTVSQKCH